ncbi:MAG: gliding motility-associated C-terminal domain-containing protein [Lewinellaceae bacterium]|nr:gliding motility-associated C-terminal domain-containing protein [Lewinellaceae bacterium]
MRQIILISLILLCFSSTSFATHIVGGEMTYRCLGGNQYEISLTVYRDCYNGVPWFDNPAIVGVYDANWNLKQNLALNLSGVNDTLPIQLVNPCLTVPPDVCVHGTTYKRIITLNFSPGGYTLVYQRCCRNKLIRNIPDPLNTGISIVAEIEEEALLQCNNGATFNNWPPVAICVHQPIAFDHAASDEDGDSLVYRLCTPLSGPDSTAPAPNPPFPGPYMPVTWTDPPYNLSNVLGGDPLTIDPQSGFLNGVPNTIGNFVVGVCVDEYRNGTVISTTRRDFQYNVSDCGEPTASFFTPELLCDTLSVKFFNFSSGATLFKWYFDWENNQQITSPLFSPIHTFPDTGYYTVALIVDPGDPCSDTSFQVIHLTKTYVNAAIELTLPDCDENGLQVQAFDMSQDPVFGLGAWDWTLSGPNGVAATSMEQNPAFVVNESGDFTLRLIAKGANGCPDTAYQYFTSSVPDVQNLESDLFICQGDTVGLWPGANPAYSYAWSAASTISNTGIPNPLAFPNEDATYTVTVTNNDCSSLAEVMVHVVSFSSLVATADPTRIYLGESSQLNAQILGPGTYSWTPSGTLVNAQASNPIATPTTTTTYTVTVALPTGCSASVSVTVEVLSPQCDEPYLFFPTGFSPNGDGQNDVLQLEGRYLEEVYWVIYNRWGEQVFEAHQPADSWDGTYKGKEMPAGAYGYYLRVVCPGGEVFVKKGNVTLLR